ncbi:hypothetical protein [Streptomyces sp. NPDC055085]
MAIEDAYRVYCQTCQAYLRLPKTWSATSRYEMVHAPSMATEFPTWDQAREAAKTVMRREGDMCDTCWKQAIG